MSNLPHTTGLLAVLAIYTRNSLTQIPSFGHVILLNFPTNELIVSRNSVDVQPRDYSRCKLRTQLWVPGARNKTEEEY